MSHVLIITKGTHQGNRMGDPDNITYNEQYISTSIKSLDVFCKSLIEALENYEDASNFQEEVEKLKPQLEVDNYAQLNFEYPSSRYKLTIVPPKFE